MLFILQVSILSEQTFNSIFGELDVRRLLAGFSLILKIVLN